MDYTQTHYSRKESMPATCLALAQNMPYKRTIEKDVLAKERAQRSYDETREMQAA